MEKKLYVGSLPFETTEDELHQMFAGLGQIVSAKLITDKDSGQSKGFGFVEMSTEAEAQAAIQKLHGSTLGTRQITVNEARPMVPRSPGGNSSFGGGKGRGNFNRR